MLYWRCWGANRGNGRVTPSTISKIIDWVWSVGAMPTPIGMKGMFVIPNVCQHHGSWLMLMLMIRLFCKLNRYSLQDQIFHAGFKKMIKYNKELIPIVVLCRFLWIQYITIFLSMSPSVSHDFVHPSAKYQLIPENRRRNTGPCLLVEQWKRVKTKASVQTCRKVCKTEIGFWKLETVLIPSLIVHSVLLVWTSPAFDGDRTNILIEHTLIFQTL